MDEWTNFQPVNQKKKKKKKISHSFIEMQNPIRKVFKAVTVVSVKCSWTTLRENNNNSNGSSRPQFSL